MLLLYRILNVGLVHLIYLFEGLCMMDGKGICLLIDGSSGVPNWIRY